MLLYIGSYAVLSSQGQYVPRAWGLAWVKWYVWAPRGFVSGPMGTGQNRVLQILYLPLWGIDMQLLHKSDQLPDKKYPINTTMEQAFEKGREQNKVLDATSL